jgi:hypothetical protein
MQGRFLYQRELKRGRCRVVFVLGLVGLWEEEEVEEEGEEE